MHNYQTFLYVLQIPVLTEIVLKQVHGSIIILEDLFHCC